MNKFKVIRLISTITGILHSSGTEYLSPGMMLQPWPKLTKLLVINSLYEYCSVRRRRLGILRVLRATIDDHSSPRVCVGGGGGRGEGGKDFLGKYSEWEIYPRAVR